MRAHELAAPVADRPAGRGADRRPVGRGGDRLAGRGDDRLADRAAIPAADATPARRGAWRQPVVWLALAVFVASVLGCIGMIVLANRLADPSTPASAGPTIMKMPIERQPLPSLPEPAPAARRPGASD